MKYSFDDTMPLSPYRRIMADKVQQGEVCPWWKSYVYHDFVTNYTVVAPLGFHLVFRWLHTFWWWTRVTGLDSKRFYHEQLKLRGYFK